MTKVTRSRLTTSALLILLIVFFYFVSQIDTREDFSLRSHNAYELNEGWTVTYDDETLSNISLPYDLNLKPSTKYSIRTELPNLEPDRNTLLIRSSMQDMWVYLDNKLIYEQIKPEKGLIDTPSASVWLTVNLPVNYQGKELRIDISSPISSFSGVINSIKLDSKDVLLFGLIEEQLFGLVVISLLLFTGAGLILLSLFLKISEDSRILYLGFVAFTTSLWLLAESRLLQFITGNRFILGSFAYIVIPLMSIFFALYVREAVITDKRFKKYISYFVYVMQVSILLSILLQVLGIQSYIQSMNYELIMILIGAITACGFMIVEVRNYQNLTAKRLAKFTIVLLVSLLLEVVSFYLGTFQFTSSFLRVGSFIFFLLLTIDTISYVRESMQQRSETALLEKLAYKDFLTGGLNRTSYEKDLEKRIDSKQSFRLNLMDLNYLKYINDNFGHNVGDEAIKHVYEALELAFKDIGTCYRIGGDEFSVIMDNIDPIINQEAINRFNQLLDEINQTFVFQLEVAIGTDIYMVDKWEQFSKFYHHVDQKMYEDKTKIKSAKS